MDLDAPLGMKPPPKPKRVGLALGVVGVLAAVVALAGVGVFLATADPHGGEPYAVAAIPPALPKPPPRAVIPPPLDPTATGSLPRVEHDPTLGAEPRSTRAAVAPTGVAGGPLIIDVAKALADRQHIVMVPPAEAPASAPVEAPAPPFVPARAIVTPPAPPPIAQSPVAEPRVAIFISGMGLNQTATRMATEIMPAGVTFAFVPYGDTVGADVAAAKAKGHEIVLLIPMQNAGGPAQTPHALRENEPPSEVADDAAWLMNRLEGYDGIGNLLGAPVTEDRAAMGALLKAIGSRDLFYLDDNTSRRSVGPAVALEQGVPAARADIVLDATGDPAVVRANLETLVAIARRKGSAIGVASGLPDHFAAIADFASRLSTLKVKLVPVGTLVARNAAVAVAR